ncbi:MAG TPA: threonine--tRNA ligase [Planctomycetaceae bacterium]|nr:threonine--tRNA ligase [Planctomycetaceae bacterium]
MCATAAAHEDEDHGKTGEMRDEAALKADGEKHIPKGYDPELYRIRHSMAHVMAEAMLARFPTAKLGFGPPIENGFYYDFDLPENPSDEDLAWVEKEMARIIKGKHAFHVKEVTPAEARTLFHDQPLKLELIAELERGSVDEYGNPTGAPTGDNPLTVYQQDTFVDVCRGPHVPDTGGLDPQSFKLLSVNGAYWRGSEKNPMLKRVYATAWRNKAELDDHLKRLEEAKNRDHRKIGKEQELFLNHPLIGAGLPMWLPKGAVIRRQLEQFILELERAAGYQHVYTPDIAKQDLYEVSGHWAHYKDSMFPPMEMEFETLVLRPMNCPHHILIFDSKQRSYRDLPVRIAELGKMYRFEKSGVVSGLSRVRCMCLNDAHLFCRADQIKSEFANVLRLVEKAYKILGITDYSYRLSLRDPKDTEKYVQNDALWELGEQMLREAMQEVGVNFREAEGEAAFYGPKCDIQIRDVLGREETLSTIQVDFHLPNQFGLKYTDQNDQEVRPVILHRGVISTMERMTAYLIELYAGAFPPWLAPVQAMLVPVADRHVDFAKQIAERLLAADYRCEVDDSNRRMNAKIRDAEIARIPYTLVIGDREIEAQSVSVRLRSGENLGAMPIDKFCEMLKTMVSTRSLKLVEG